MSLRVDAPVLARRANGPVDDDRYTRCPVITLPPLAGAVHVSLAAFRAAAPLDTGGPGTCLAIVVVVVAVVVVVVAVVLVVVVGGGAGRADEVEEVRRTRPGGGDLARRRCGQERGGDGRR